MIEMNDAAYGYGSEPLLSGLTLNLAPGSFHFLTGPSGAGKTTFLKLCYAELLPTGGNISLFGHTASGLSRDGIADLRQRIGVVHQDCKFLDHLPLMDNLALPLTVTGKGNIIHRGIQHPVITVSFSIVFIATKAALRWFYFFTVFSRQ